MSTSPDRLLAPDTGGTPPAPVPRPELIGLFASLDASAEATSGPFYVDNELLDLAAILTPPAVLGARPDPPASPAPPISPGPRPVPTPEPPSAPLATEPDQTSTPASEPTAPAAEERATPAAGNHRRRWLTALAVLLAVALMLPTAWFLARGPLTSPTASTPRSAAPTMTSVAAAPMQAEYAAVLASVVESRTLAALSAAATQATTLAQRFATLSGASPAGEKLVRAQAASLQAFGALDGLTRANVSRQFPALMPTLTSTGRAVNAARAALPGTDPGTDAAVAGRHVLRLLGPLALRGLSDRLAALINRVGAASTTADLRAVAADSYSIRVATEDTATVLAQVSDLGARAGHLRDAATTLAALKGIDGDHLDDWGGLATRLRTHLSGAQMPSTALAALGKADQMIAAARLVLKTWDELHAGPTAAELSRYQRQVTSAWQRWNGAFPDLAPLDVDTTSSAVLARQYRRAAASATAALAALRKTAVPDGAAPDLITAHRALVTLATAGRDLVAAGQTLTSATADCGPACLLGESPRWKPYADALDHLEQVSQRGDAVALEGAWRSAYDAAAAEAAAVPPASAKPVV